MNTYTPIWEDRLIGYVNNTAYYKKTELGRSAYFYRERSNLGGDYTDTLEFAGFSPPANLIPA